MHCVFKYPLHTIDHQEVPMPVGAKLLAVQVQHGTPCLWALVATDVPKTVRSIATYGTGHPHDGEGAYVGTYQLDDGSLVFHVFDRGERAS